MTTERDEQRIRLRFQSTAFTEDPYGDSNTRADGTGASSILGPLKETGGLLFPYTPSIQISQEVDYNAVNLVHSNQDYHAYTRTPQATISITGKFTVQNQKEGRYGLAALHFLKTASRMYFGEKDRERGMAGIPPPVLLLDGYGKYMFNDTRVILKSHNYSFDDNIDTVPIYDGTTLIVRLPALFTVQISLTPQQTPERMRRDFSLDEFRTGKLLDQGGWF